MKIKTKCKQCQHVIIWDIEKSHAGRVIANQCPNPNCCANAILKVTPEIVELIDKLEKQQKDKTYVPTINPNSPEKENNEILVLTTQENESTPLQRFVLTQPYNIIGRKNYSAPTSQPDIEIVTTDKFMSKKHCLICNLGKGQFTLQDRNSTNGTKLNNRLLESEEIVYLEKGDVIRIGHTDLYVSFHNE